MNIDELTQKKGKKKIVNKNLDEHALNCTFSKNHGSIHFEA
jgi:hypothetical protein